VKSYPIWSEVSGTGRKNEPNHGAHGALRYNIAVGTSARNSHDFAHVEVERLVQHDGRVEFALYVDSVLIKRGMLDGKQFNVDIDGPADFLPSDLAGTNQAN
jgi:hypothetical protein